MEVYCTEEQDITDFSYTDNTFQQVDLFVGFGIYLRIVVAMQKYRKLDFFKRFIGLKKL